MALNKIWNLRADPAWIELVKIQAIEAGRDNPGAYVRDLVCTLAKNPTIKNSIFGLHVFICFLTFSSFRLDLLFFELNDFVEFLINFIKFVCILLIHY